MPKRIIQFFWFNREQFTRYLVVGFSGAALDLGTLIFFKNSFGLSGTLAVFFNQLIILLYNFNLNKYWSFKNRELPHKQLVRYMTLACVNYILAVLLMYIFNEIFGIHAVLVRIGSIGLSAAWNFVLFRNWVYKETCA